MKHRGPKVVLAALALLAWVSPAVARSPWVGHYRVAEGPDVAGELELRQDGSFSYALAAGALDEHAEGAWLEGEGVVRLTTQPKPAPAAFSRGPDDPAAEASLRVVFPNGRGIAGIDFRLGLADGSQVSDYTQVYGWSFPDGERRAIRWVELVEPLHGVASPRFVIAPGAAGGLTFMLTPNDIEVFDFEGAAFRGGSDSFVLDHGGYPLRFVRIAQ